MTRTFTTFLCLLLSLSLSAQYQKGNYYLNGGRSSASANHSRFPVSYTPFDYRVSGGVFTEERLMLGVELSGGDEFGAASYHSFAPFIRYYLPGRKNEERLRYYLEAGLRATLYERSIDLPQVIVAAGAEYALRDNLFLSGQLKHKFESGFFGHRTTLELSLNNVFTPGLNDDDAEFINRAGTYMIHGDMGTIALFDGLRNVFGEIDVKGGYFLSSSFMVTGGLSVFRQRIDRSSSSIEWKEHRFATNAAAGLRYHFRNGKRFQPYLAGGLRYYYESLSGENVINVGNSHSLHGESAAGFLYFLKDNVAIDLQCGARALLAQSDGGNNDNRIKLYGRTGVAYFVGRGGK